MAVVVEDNAPKEAVSSHPDPRPRPECPRCGSGHTQPFAHAGPAARVNMKCIDCDMLFRSRVSER